MKSKLAALAAIFGTASLSSAAITSVTYSANYAGAAINYNSTTGGTVVVPYNHSGGILGSNPSTVNVSYTFAAPDKGSVSLSVSSAGFSLVASGAMGWMGSTVTLTQNFSLAIPTLSNATLVAVLFNDGLLGPGANNVTSNDWNRVEDSGVNYSDIINDGNATGSFSWARNHGGPTGVTPSADLTHTMNLNNLTYNYDLVPEPTSALLVSTASLFFFRRKRTVK